MIDDHPYAWSHKMIDSSSIPFASPLLPPVLSYLASCGVRPYTPFLNPIENAFTKVKKWLRKHNQYARHLPILAIEKALKSVTPDMAIRFYRKAGYLK